MSKIATLTSTVLIVISVGVGTVSATTPAHLHTSQANWVISPRRPLIRIPPEGPCPKSIRDFNDVANTEDSLRSHLLPPGALFGIICRYITVPKRTPYKLYRRSLINGRTAAAFEDAINNIQTERPEEIVSCPAKFIEATVLAFGYLDGHFVDLWYEDSGCQTLDNGYLEASETTDPPFQNFIQLVNQIAPLPNP